VLASRHLATILSTPLRRTSAARCSKYRSNRSTIFSFILETAVPTLRIGRSNSVRFALAPPSPGADVHQRNTRPWQATPRAESHRIGSIRLLGSRSHRHVRQRRFDAILARRHRQKPYLDGYTSISNIRCDKFNPALAIPGTDPCPTYPAPVTNTSFYSYVFVPVEAIPLLTSP
jgi:hypothetical protein